MSNPLKKTALLAFALVISLSSVAHANSGEDLIGRTLTCSTDLSQTFGGTQNTTYEFTKGPRQQLVALIFNEGSMDNGTRNSPFSVSGSTLTLDVGGHTLTYDLSNPKDIERVYQNCVFPGQGGGDARPVCANVVERCTLE